jgi:hypothetical protein
MLLMLFYCYNEESQIVTGGLNIVSLFVENIYFAAWKLPEGHIQ